MNIANIADLRQLAWRRLPRVLFDYIDGGAQDEVTLRANQDDFNRITLAQRVLRDVSVRDQSVTVMGQKYGMPLILSPTGMTGLFWPNGALVLTVDLALQGQRDRDVHNGLTIPPTLRMSNLPNFATRPGWVSSGPNPSGMGRLR